MPKQTTVVPVVLATLAATACPITAYSAPTLVVDTVAVGGTSPLLVANLGLGVTNTPVDSGNFYGLMPGVRNTYSATSSITGLVTRDAGYNSGPYHNVLLGTDSPSQTAYALADVNLGLGTLKLYSSSNLIDSSSPLMTVSTVSGAQIVYGDSIHFTNSAATAATVTTVTFSLASTGSLSAQAAGGSALFSTGLSINGVDQQGDVGGGMAYITDFCNKSGCAASQSNGIDSGSFVSGSLTAGIVGTTTNSPFAAGTDRISASFAFRGQTADVVFLVNETAQTSGGIADFSHTALLGVSAPSGVTWTSDSQLLLAAVPEPEEYALMLAGLGVIGAFIRRRDARRQTPATAAA